MPSGESKGGDGSCQECVNLYEFTRVHSCFVNLQHGVIQSVNDRELEWEVHRKFSPCTAALIMSGDLSFQTDTCQFNLISVGKS